MLKIRIRNEGSRIALVDQRMADWGWISWKCNTWRRLGGKSDFIPLLFSLANVVHQALESMMVIFSALKTLKETRLFLRLLPTITTHNERRRQSVIHWFINSNHSFIGSSKATNEIWRRHTQCPTPNLHTAPNAQRKPQVKR